MKRAILSVGLMLALGVSGTALAADTAAQTPPPQAPAAGPAPGMGHGPQGRPEMAPRGAPHRPGFGRGMAGRDGIPGIFESLDLTPKQRETIGRLMNEQRSMQQAQFHEMSAAAQKMHALYAADRWDADAILKAEDAVYQKRRGLMRKMIEMHNKVYDVLTPAQRKKLKELRASARKGPGVPAPRQ